MTSKKVAKSQDVVVEPSAIMQVIQQAATNPDVDIDKMERLMGMHERMVDKQNETTFNNALTAAQSEMGRVRADASNPQTRSQYASYAALDRSLRPIYTAHGFALSFDTGDGPEDYVRVLCHVSNSGFTKTYHVDMPADGKGAKGGDVMTKTHAVGAGMSYGMRYLLKMIFNVAVGEDDVDGNMPIETITEEQAADLNALREEVGVDLSRFLKWARVPAIDEIPAENYSRCVTKLEISR